MKKVISHFILINLIILLASISFSEELETKWILTKSTIKGQNFTTTTDNLYNDIGKVVQKKTVTTTPTSKTEQTSLIDYDENGLMIKEVTIVKSNNGVNSRMETSFENNYNGKPSKKSTTVYYNGNKVSQTTSVYEYDSEGRETKSNNITANASGQINKIIIVKEYDACGKMIKLLNQTSGNSNLTETKYTYGENCLPKKSTTIVNGEMLARKDIYEYDSNGKLIATTSENYGVDGKLVSLGVQKTTYDENGNAEKYDHTITNKMNNTIQKIITELEFVKM